ncbi:chlorohydrolase [Vallitalea longa]|uniref:Chlorohydrolase n=1 Tax=Vallitalea longa TaxID=2936439 RepID=A0A9W6DEC7_9FIRM|nr:putative aminohydrolase SsnA [Vallitalea longa]GKX30031.1 chlorohydrolase [Vallitalea longa]
MILLGNGKLITRDENNPFIEDGCVCVKDNFVWDIGKTKDMKQKYPNEEFIDAQQGLIMPGLINTHHHIYSSFARGLSIDGYNPQKFTEILEGMWWKIDESLTLDDVKYSAYVTYIDCIKNGVTTVFDHHASYGDTSDSLSQISSVAHEVGIRTSLCYEISDRKGRSEMEKAVKENINFIDYCKSDTRDMQKGMMGLHASFTLSDETLCYIAENMPADTGYHIHVSEGIEDLYHSMKKYNKRVINRLYDMDILGPRTLAIHCIHINPLEMDILKETNTMVVNNPESNMGNAVGCTPIFKILDKGIVLGLGTDGYTSDMLESMKVANILHKHNSCNPSAAWNEVPQMLFENNATIANRFYNRPLGTIKKGAYADVIIVDYDSYTPLNSNNYNSHILFGVNGRNVKTTMINGKLLMKDYKLIDIDEAKINAKARELSSILWKKF